MDAKKKRNTILAIVAFFVLIAIVVCAANWNQISVKLGLSSASNTTAQNTQTDGEDDAEEETASLQIGNDLSAFMQDETFFDEEVKYKSIENYSGKAVSMVMSSVAKDLRIMIVDSRGNLVTGVPFTVTIQDMGEYTDEDEDGIIYIASLRAGEYSVSLNEMDGYAVPNTVTTIRVKQSIDYKVMDSIEYLMLTEADVDAEIEDTEVKDAESTADGTENTELVLGGGSLTVGIDVSKWNQEIDWEAVKEAGVEFAIIRCGYRGASTGALIVDPMFTQNIEGAIAAGIPVGVYFFTQAVTEVEAVEEASMVIDLIRQYDVDYPVFLDSESAGGAGRADNLSTSDRTKISLAFLQTIKTAGYETGIYGSTNWLNNRLNMTDLSAYRTWLAEYADIPSYAGYYHMWQYTSKGYVNGISTNVDLDYCYLDIDTSVNRASGASSYTGVVSGDTGNVPTD